MIKRVKEHFLTLPQKIELLVLYGAVMFAMGVGLNYLLKPEYPNYYDDGAVVDAEVKDFSDYDDNYDIAFVETEAPALEPKKSQNDIALTELPPQLPARGAEIGVAMRSDVHVIEELEAPVDVVAVVEPEVEPEAALDNADDVVEERVEPEAAGSFVHEHIIKKGDTLSDILVKAGVDEKEVYYIGRAVRKVFNIRSLKIGQKIDVRFANGANGALLFERLRIFEREQIVNVVKQGDEDFKSAIEKKDLTVKLMFAQGNIQSSLYGLGEQLNVPLKIMTDFIRYYSFDVDFQRDIQKGNKFAVMYEVYVDEDGKKIKDGNLMYGLLTVGSKDLAIYRHSATGDIKDIDYYTDGGMTLRKSLMKTPINGAVISSPYGKRRHPVLGYTKVHKGVDFAAPRGTPFYAAGDGVIEFIGRNGAYGNYIRIRHGGEYKTAYAHIHKFAKGMRKGLRVRQGQIIAYVGTTGRSTGPHLHYEILRNDKQINPMKIKIPARKRLSGTKLDDFEKVRATILQQLNLLEK